MPTTVRPTSSSAARIALAALLGLAPLAASSARAGNLGVDITATVASRAGFPGQLTAVAIIQSPTGNALDGTVTLVVNGTVRKVEPVATSGTALVMVDLGFVSGAITTCAAFGGQLDMGDANILSVQDTDCMRYVAPVRAPTLPVGVSTRTPRTPPAMGGF